MVLSVVCGMIAVLALTSCGRSEKKETEAVKAPQTNAPAITLVSTNVSVATIQTNFPLRGAGLLQLEMPTSWVAHVTESATNSEVPSTTILFANTEGLNFAIELTAVFDAENRLALNARSACEKAMENARPRALEKTVFVQDMSGPQFLGHYFSITDKTLVDRMPPPGEFKYLTQGTGKMAQVVMSFRIFSNNPAGDDRKTALEMLRNMQLIRR